MRNICNDEKYIQERLDIEKFFDERVIFETESIQSPFGKYLLTINYYNFEDDSRRYYYSKGIITFDDNSRIEIKRNYSHFPFCWIDFKSGKEFLICGEDYQGYSIVDLKNREVKHYIPEEAYEGSGFCWVQVHYKPGNDIIAVEGCIWGAPYEIAFFDFQNPMDLPYKEIMRVEEDYGEVIGWKDERTFEYTDGVTKDIKTIKIL